MKQQTRIFQLFVALFAGAGTGAGCEQDSEDIFCGVNWCASATGATTICNGRPLNLYYTENCEIVDAAQSYVIQQSNENDPEFIALREMITAGAVVECEDMADFQCPGHGSTTCEATVGDNLFMDDYVYMDPDEADEENCPQRYVSGATDTTEGDDGTDAGFVDLEGDINCSGGSCDVHEDVWNQFFNDPNAFLNDGTRLRQHKNGAGAPDGWEVKGVASGNLGHALGFSNGDRITHVNEQAVTDIDDALSVAVDLWDETSVEVDYVTSSGNQTVTLHLVTD